MSYLDIFKPKPKPPNYRIIELEAENENLKDQLIAQQKETIEALREEIRVLNINIENFRKPIESSPSEISAPKPRISTMTQLARALEQASLVRRAESRTLAEKS